MEMKALAITVEYVWCTSCLMDLAETNPQFSPSADKNGTAMSCTKSCLPS